MSSVGRYLYSCGEFMAAQVTKHITKGKYAEEVKEICICVAFDCETTNLLTYNRTNKIGAYLEYAAAAIVEYTKDLTRIGGLMHNYLSDDVSTEAAFAIREACCEYMYSRLRYKSRHDRRIIRANLDNIKMFIRCGDVAPALDMIQKYFPYIPTSDKALMEWSGRN